ncbi:MAG: hypothetical protein AB7R89_33315 [Dehalococcoidia bacterium]
MRTLISKYAGQCARCGQDIPIGATIRYEKRTGVFCVGCEPTDVEDIRSFRQAKIDRKNARREEWAQARERRANAYQRRSDHLMGRDTSPDGRADWALVTQPGYIPQRAQANRAQERAWDEQNAAAAHRARMSPDAYVKGDRERARQQHRDAVRDRLRAHVGQQVTCHPYGLVTLIRVNGKSATVETPRGFRDRVDLTWIEFTTTSAAAETQE